MTYFEIYLDNAKIREWRWRLWENYEIIAASNDGHRLEKQCKDEVRKVMRTNKNTPVEDEEGNQIKMFPNA